MKPVIKIIVVLVGFFIVSCAEERKEAEVNKILQMMIEHHQDSLNLYFKPTVDSLGVEKFKKVITYNDKPDSIALYYKSADTLRFEVPITKKKLKIYDLVDQYHIDSLVTSTDIIFWNKAINQYKSRKWSNNERKKLPIIKKNPRSIEGFYSPENELQTIFYYSTPFFNKNRTKALIYQHRVSKVGKSGHLYILFKNKGNWNITFDGNIYISTF